MADEDAESTSGNTRTASSTPAAATDTPHDYIFFKDANWDAVMLVTLGALSTLVIVILVIVLRTRLKKRFGGRGLSIRSRPEEFELQERPLPAAPNQYEPAMDEAYDNRTVAEFAEGRVADSLYSEARRCSTSSSEVARRSELVGSQCRVVSQSRGSRTTGTRDRPNSGSIVYEAVTADGDITGQEDQVQYEDVSLSVTPILRMPSSVSELKSHSHKDNQQGEYEEIDKEGSNPQNNGICQDKRNDASSCQHSRRESESVTGPLSPTHTGWLSRMGRTSFDQIPVPGQKHLLHRPSCQVSWGTEIDTCSIISEASGSNVDVFVVDNATYAPYEEDARPRNAITRVQDSADDDTVRKDPSVKEDSNLDDNCDNIVDNVAYVPFETDLSSNCLPESQNQADSHTDDPTQSLHHDMDSASTRDSTTHGREQTSDEVHQTTVNLTTDNDSLGKDSDSFGSDNDSLRKDGERFGRENGTDIGLAGDLMQTPCRRLSSQNIDVPIEDMRIRGSVPLVIATDVDTALSGDITSQQSANTPREGHIEDHSVYCEGVFIQEPGQGSKTPLDVHKVMNSATDGVSNDSDVYVCGETQFA